VQVLVTVVRPSVISGRLIMRRSKASVRRRSMSVESRAVRNQAGEDGLDGPRTGHLPDPDDFAQYRITGQASVVVR
jgi:hypothetical protein